MRDSHGARSLESYRFGVFDFDGRTLELRKAGRLIAIRPQPLKLLALLLARPNDLVTRDDLQRALWGDDTFVDFEQGVNHAVRELRAALGDVAESPRFIETLPRRGYRFIAPVAPLAAGARPIRRRSPRRRRRRRGTPPIRRRRRAAVAAAEPAIPTRRWAMVAGAAARAGRRPGVAIRPSAGRRSRARPSSSVPSSPATTTAPRASASPTPSPPGSADSGCSIIRPEGRGNVAAGSLVLDGEIVVDGGDVTVTARLQDPVVEPDRLVGSRARAGRPVLRRRGGHRRARRRSAAPPAGGRGTGTAAAALYEQRHGLRVVPGRPGRAGAVHARRHARGGRRVRDRSARRSASTRWPGPGWPWPVRTNICGSRPPTKSSAGPGGQRPKPARPWRSIRIWPRRIWPGRRSPASGSSTGARPSSRAGGHCCSIPTCRRRTSSSPPPTTISATWRRRRSPSTTVAASAATTSSSRSASTASSPCSPGASPRRSPTSRK